MDQIRNRMPNPISAILYLRRNCLEVYPVEDGSQAVMEYPWSAYKNLKILDQARIEEIFGNFLLKHRIKFRRYLIVLADEILHKRTVPITVPELDKKTAEDFYGQIPFNPEKMIRKEIRTETELNLYAFNKELFVTIKKIIEKNSGEVLAVVPASSFGFSDPNIIFTPEVLRIFGENEELLKKADFLEGVNEDKSNRRRTTMPSIKRVNNLNRAKTFIFWLVIAVALTAAYISLVVSLRAKNAAPAENLSPESAIPIITIPATPAASTSAEPRENTPEPTKNNYLTAKDLKINILNGGNVAGLAGKTQDLFRKSGYVIITIGNKTDYSNEETEITFSSRVSPNDRRQVLQILTELVKTTAVIEPPTEPPFDISIILGKGL